jgi:transaldolase
MFISRWDKATMGKVPRELQNQLGIAVAQSTYHAYRKLLDSDRWRKAEKAGAQPQRLLWASTGTKDPSASDCLYVEALAAPDTINTIPEKTLLAFADHGKLGQVMPVHGGEENTVIAEFEEAGIDIRALAANLQEEGAEGFITSWKELLSVVEGKTAALKVPAH